MRCDFCDEEFVHDDSIVAVTGAFTVGDADDLSYPLQIVPDDQPYMSLYHSSEGKDCWEDAMKMCHGHDPISCCK